VNEKSTLQGASSITITFLLFWGTHIIQYPASFLGKSPLQKKSFSLFPLYNKREKVQSLYPLSLGNGKTYD